MPNVSAPPTTDDALGRRVSKSAVWALLNSAPVACFVAGTLARRWTNEDAFINLRVIRQLLQGHGLVYNLGERVEAGTSPLWLWLLSVGGLTGLRLEYAAVYGGLLLGLTGLLLGALASLLGRSPPTADQSGFRLRFVAPLGLGVIAVLPPVWDFVGSGLETGLTLCWLGASAWLLIRLAIAQDACPTGGEAGAVVLPKGWTAAAVVVGLGPLVRPEFGLHTLGLLAALCYARWRSQRAHPVSAVRGVGWLLATALALPLAYQLFRMGYFAALTPNTALAKEAFASRWLQGYYYVEDFFGTYYLVVPVLALLVVWASHVRTLYRSGAVTLAVVFTVLPLCSAAHGVYVTRLGGDFMHGRMLIPVLFGLLLPVFTVELRGPRRWSRALRIGVCIVVLVWLPWCALSLRVSPHNSHGIGDERGWQARMTRQKNPVTLGDQRHFLFYALAEQLLRSGASWCPSGGFPVRAMRNHGCEPSLFVLRSYHHVPPRFTRYALTAAAPPGVALAVGLGASGTAGYLMGSAVHVVDIQGLTDPIAARMRLDRRQRPGHEKWLPWPWLVARFAEPRAGEPREVTAARRALGCGELAELREATTAPLGWRLFARNITRAWRLQRLRIPRDPLQAEAEFCGGALPL